MRDTEAQLVDSRSASSAATLTATLWNGGLTLTGIFSTRSTMKLLMVAAVMVGGLLWVGGSEDVHAGGKGNDKGAKVETTNFFLEFCFGGDLKTRTCTTITIREHLVDTKSGNFVKISRVLITEQVRDIDTDAVISEISRNITRSNRLDKDGEEHTLRSFSFVINENGECQIDLLVANGEIRFHRIVGEECQLQP